MEELSSAPSRRKTWQKIALHAFFFILGFSSVFVVLGASASALGTLFAQYQKVVRQVGGIFVIFLGLTLTGVFKFGFLMKEKKFSLPKKATGLFGSFLVGVIFSFGWTPCVGPILGSILVLAGTSESLERGIFFLLVYSLGLAVPFFVSALAMNLFLSSFQKIKRFLRWIEVGSGIVLIGIGVLLVTNSLYRLTAYLNSALAPLVRLFNL